MSFWTIVTLILIGSMMFGPIMMVQPSSRDKRQARLRARATDYQLRVSLEAMPRQATDMEAPEQTPVYTLHHRRGGAPRWQLIRGSYEHERQFLGHWRWQNDARPSAEELERLRTWLPQLPDSVLGLGAGAGGWYVYWTELGGEEVMAEIARGLKALRDCSRPRASAPD